MQRSSEEISELDVAKWETQLRKGSLGLAVLASLWRGECYGLELLRHLEGTAGFTVPEGTIYPLLSRLKAAKLVDSSWVETEAGHPRKYFRLTADGRRYARGIADSWFAFVGGMNKLLEPLEEKTRARYRAG